MIQTNDSLFTHTHHDTHARTNNDQVLDPPPERHDELLSLSSSTTAAPAAAPIIRHAIWAGGAAQHPEGLTWQDVSQVRFVCNLDVH